MSVKSKDTEVAVVKAKGEVIEFKQEVTEIKAPSEMHIEPEFRIKRVITVPVLHHEPGHTVYIKFLGEIVKTADREKATGEVEKGPHIAEVANLRDGVIYKYIVNAVAVSEFSQIPYLHRSFAIWKDVPRKGRKHSEIRIVELED